MEQLGSHWTVFKEIWYLNIFRKSAEKIQVSLEADKNNGNFQENRNTFFITPRSVFLRMRTVSDRSCIEYRSKLFIFKNFFFFENRAVYEVMWENIVDMGRQQMTWRMCIACWVPKATNTLSEYIMLTAFPLQQWLHERASMLGYTYIACLASVLPSVSLFLTSFFVPFRMQTYMVWGRRWTSSSV